MMQYSTVGFFHFSLFRLLYSSTSTVQHLEISRVQYKVQKFLDFVLQKFLDAVLQKLTSKADYYGRGENSNFFTHQSVNVRKITQEKHELQSTLDNSACLKVLQCIGNGENVTCMWSKNFILHVLGGEARNLLYRLGLDVFQPGLFCFSHFCSGIVRPQLIFAAHNSAFHNLVLA